MAFIIKEIIALLMMPFPYAGITRIRFEGYALSPDFLGAPLRHTEKIYWMGITEASKILPENASCF